MISDFSKSSSNSTNFIMFFAYVLGCGVVAITSTPKPSKACATRYPIFPTPDIPRVFPLICCTNLFYEKRKYLFFISFWISLSLFKSFRIIITVNSAMDSGE